MDICVSDQRDRHRFEVHLDGELAGFVTYYRPDRTYFLTHTEIFDVFQGRGLASHLVSKALDLIVSYGDYKIVPQCSYISAWIERHPHYSFLVAQ